MEAANILFVEDDPILRPMYADRIREEGYQVDDVITGEQAQKKLEENQYDLVLLDVMLPKMSGLDVLQWARGRAETKDLPIVLLSALETDEDKTRGRELGATDYIAKAESTPKTVVEAIKHYLNPQ
ncbi:MAG: response regulator [bacterium]|nr:response regulator [bacterium]